MKKMKLQTYLNLYKILRYAQGIDADASFII